MTDTDDGGGEMSANVVIDGQMHQVFSPISDSDRNSGDVALRQLYVHINTNTADTYYGANIIISDNPVDTNVDALLFKTGVHGQERLDAQKAIESYAIPGPPSAMTPINTQQVGQRQIIAYQSLTSRLPDVGDTYFLSVDSGTLIGTQQAIKITSVAAETAIFIYMSGSNPTEYKCTKLTLGISQSLTTTFPGNDPAPTRPGDTKIRMATIADSAKYFGTVNLTGTASPGDLSFNVNTTWKQLVPSSLSEVAVIDTPANQVVNTLVYGSRSVEVSEFGYSDSIDVTIGNRSLIWTNLLRPYPCAGTVSVSYRANSKWYMLDDSENDGVLKGASIEYGSGSVNYTTGSLTLTLGAMPDAGSSIVFQWGGTQQYENRTNSAAPTNVTVEHSVGEPIEPGSVVLTWTAGGTTKTASTSGGSSPDISGNGTGTVNYVDGKIYLLLTTVPDANSTLRLVYNAMTSVTTIDETTSPSGSTLTFSVGEAIKPGTLVLTWITKYSGSMNSTQRYAYDNGAGSFTNVGGTIDYNSGAITLTAIYPYQYSVNEPVTYTAHAYNTQYTRYGNQWTTKTVTDSYLGPLTIKYSKVVASASRDVTIPIPPLKIKFAGNTIQDSIIPGGLIFQYRGYEYRDNGAGSLFRSLIPWNTGTGTYAGTLNYFTRDAILEAYNSTGTNTVNVILCVTKYGQWLVSTVFGRAPGAPLKPGSFSIRCNSINGEITATANAAGVIQDIGIAGIVNHEMGTFSVGFGAMISDTSLTPEQKQESWYDVNKVVNGYIWKPNSIDPSSIKMNCVVQTPIPLDASELGLDPVRLPSDGRVVVFKPGYRLVVHYTGVFNIANITAGGSYDVGWTRLSRVKLVDANGVRIPDNRVNFAASNLNTGIVVLSSPLNLTDYTAPYSIYYTIEDSGLCTAVDLSGYISINRALSHNFPLGTKVSSQLFLGDMFARYSYLFTQSSWTSVWQDTLIGTAPTLKYDDALYPITVHNSGTIHERWRVNFTSITNPAAFQLIGERVGLIAVGDVNTDLSPVNPATGTPYFILDHRGWGSGGAAIGNQLRFNTYGPDVFWIIRSVKAGSSSSNLSDNIKIALRGDVI
jgi:hypothetical protein